ncbi:MAG: DUF6754 domain-containing protein [Bacillota bacterium]|jgi:hypothetical protein
MVAREGGRFAFVAFMLLSAVLYQCYNKVKSGTRPYFRQLPGLEGLEEAIGRAAEMGRPVHFTPGSDGFSSGTAGQTLAAAICLSHVAGLCAKYDVRLLVSNRRSEVQPLTEEIVKQAYLSAGKIDSFRATDIRFFSDDQFAYASSVIGMLSGEKTASNIMLGGYYAESLMFAEAGATYGNIQIAGTASVAQIPFFVTTCDYVLIGEELYAAAAILSEDPAQVSTLMMQDLVRVVIVGVLIIGAIGISFGSSVLKDLILKW